MKKLLTILLMSMFFLTFVSAVPSVTIDSPVNSSTYTLNSVDLNWSVNGSIDWCGYSLDGGVNDTSITYDLWSNWTDYNDFENGFSSYYHAHPTIFYVGSDLFALVGKGNNGGVSGYFWNGTSWISNSTIKSGFGIFFETHPEVFTMNGVPVLFLFGMNGNYYASGVNAGFSSYNWNGTTWVSNASYLSGTNMTSSEKNPDGSFFEKEGDYYFIVKSSTGLLGWKWNGSSWNYNSQILNGLTLSAIGNFEVFDFEGELQLIQEIGDSYFWNGTSWEVNNLIKVGSTSPSAIIKIDGSYYEFSGIHSGATIPQVKNKTFIGISTQNTILSGLSEGSHNVILSCNNSLSEIGSSSSTFSVDTTPPTITIISPQSKNYDLPEIEVIVSADESVDTWWYSFDGGATNTTFTENFTILINEGLYTLDVFANDSIGNVGNSQVVFGFNTIIPSEIIYTGESRGIYNIMRSSGAGLGKFMLYLAQALPVLLFALALTLIVIYIGYAISRGINPELLGFKK